MGMDIVGMAMPSAAWKSEMDTAGFIGVYGTNIGYSKGESNGKENGT